MQELDGAINQLMKGKAADQTVQQKSPKKQTCNDCTPKSSSQVRNHHRTSETPRSISYIRAETRHRHPTTEPSVRSPSCDKLFCPFIRSPTTHARRPPNCLTKQAADQAAPRRTTCTHSSNSNREPPNVTGHIGTQLNTTANGGLCVNRALRSHTCRYFQSFTTDSKQQCAQTSEATDSPSNEEPSRATHVVHSCSTRFCDTS